MRQKSRQIENWTQSNIQYLPDFISTHVNVLCRTDAVSSHFPNSMLLDDFVHRLEVALYGHGFSADNTIGKS